MVNPHQDRLSEMARRKLAYLEKLQKEAVLEKQNLTVLAKVKSRLTFPSTESGNNKNIYNTDKNEMERRKQSYLEMLKKEAEVEQLNQPLVEYLRSQNNKKTFPDAINLFSNITAVDVIQKNNANQEINKEREKENAFNNLKTVINPAFARNLRDQLQALDDANKTGLITLLNSYWKEIREEIIKRFRGGGAQPDIVYQFIVGYLENLVDKFQPKIVKIQAPDDIAFSNSVIIQDPTNAQQIQPLESLVSKTLFPTEPTPSYPLSLDKYVKSHIKQDQIRDFTMYVFGINTQTEYSDEFERYMANERPTEISTQTNGNMALFFVYIMEQGVPLENNGLLDKTKFDGYVRLIRSTAKNALANLSKKQSASSSSSSTAAPPPEPIQQSSVSNNPPSTTPPLVVSSSDPNDRNNQGVGGNGLAKLKKQSKKKKNGNKKKKLKYVIKGKGAKTTKTKVKPFYVDMDNLNRNILSVKYKTSRKYKINPMVISDGEKLMINEIITYQKFNDQIFEKLSNEEKRRIESLIHELKMDHELVGYDPFAVTKDLYNQLQVIRGQIEAGNNHPSLKAMVKKIISELYALNRLTKTQANQILMELV